MMLQALRDIKKTIKTMLRYFKKNMGLVRREGKYIFKNN